MIIVDTALEKRLTDGQPVRVAMVGAGFMGRGIARQIIRHVSGMELVAISNRTLSAAHRAYEEAGDGDARVVSRVTELEDNIQRGVPSVMEDASLPCRAEGIDAIVEVTGTVEFGAGVAVDGIDHGKHVVLMNAELDGTVGPILKVRADRAGVVFTNADGDQPGVIMNLYRFVKGIGVRPALCGNIKGLHDPYRNPTTQESFARKWGQQPTMVTSFADGTKISFEQAIVANATGMRVAKRGMIGPEVEAGTPIEQAAERFSETELRQGPGLVDYVVGASPSPGVFVLGLHDDPVQQQYLSLYKLGDGPVYCFYTPYHLCHFEVPTTIARAVLFGDAAIAPIGAPQVDVVSAAKVDLRAGQTIDGIGGYTAYGLAENHDAVARDGLVPIGLAEGCRLVRDVKRDALLTYADLEVPTGRLADRLRKEQDDQFDPSSTDRSASSASDAHGRVGRPEG